MYLPLVAAKVFHTGVIYKQLFWMMCRFMFLSFSFFSLSFFSETAVASRHILTRTTAAVAGCPEKSRYLCGVSRREKNAVPILYIKAESGLLFLLQ